MYRARGRTLCGLSSSLRWRRSCSFSLLFLLRSFDSASVIEFAILEFSAKVCARCAEVIYWLFLLWAELSLLFNISSAAAALRFGVNTLPLFDCFLVYRFASCGFCLRWD